MLSLNDPQKNKIKNPCYFIFFVSLISILQFLHAHTQIIQEKEKEKARINHIEILENPNNGYENNSTNPNWIKRLKKKKTEMGREEKKKKKLPEGNSESYEEEVQGFR